MDKENPQLISSCLLAQANTNLNMAVEDELKVPDPVSQEIAIAFINENKQGEKDEN